MDQIELAEKFLGPRPRIRLTQPLQATEQDQILSTREYFIESDLLSGQHDRSTYAGRLGHDVKTGDACMASVRPREGGQDVHHCGLAGPVRTQQRNHLTPANFQTHVAQGIYGTKRLADPVDNHGVI
jgi:hypothetical protein